MSLRNLIQLGYNSIFVGCEANVVFKSSWDLFGISQRLRTSMAELMSSDPTSLVDLLEAFCNDIFSLPLEQL